MAENVDEVRVSRSVCVLLRCVYVSKEMLRYHSPSYKNIEIMGHMSSFTFLYLHQKMLIKNEIFKSSSDHSMKNHVISV